MRRRFIIFVILWCFSNLRGRRVDLLHRWEYAPRRRSTVDDARMFQRRAMDGAAPGRAVHERPRRPDRALSDRGTRSAGPEAARPCAGPPEARARRGAKAGSPRAGRRAPDAESKRFVERLRSTDRRRATGCGHGRQGRARRPYGAPPRLTRRAATAAPLIRSSPGRRVAVGRLPGKRRERGRFFGRNQGDRHYTGRGAAL